MSILDTAFALITSRTRSISGVIPDCTIREVHRDSLITTDHPVESGAIISDHAFMMPVEVEMTVGFSNSSARTEGYVDMIYQALLALQKAREPLSIFTGKRAYRNMLIRDLMVTTDAHSENVLMVSARLKEVIITSTQMTSTPQSAQANPASTASTAEGGTVQATAYGFARAV